MKLLASFGIAAGASTALYLMFVAMDCTPPAPWFDSAICLTTFHPLIALFFVGIAVTIASMVALANRM
jgi:hypothetical protein